MYEWRLMTPGQRSALLSARRLQEKPWHSPPRWRTDSSHSQTQQFHISAACYEHAHIIGTTCSRLDAFSEELLQVAAKACLQIHAWCVLTNHYHLLVETDRLIHLTKQHGRLHGRTSRFWNLEEGISGRQVWHRAPDRRMRSEAHFWTTMNYVHNNPVRHGYVARWLDWPWSSAEQYLQQVGRDEAIRIWRDYPLLDYGKKWD